jgi:hypothetical protein
MNIEKVVDFDDVFRCEDCGHTGNIRGFEKPFRRKHHAQV